MTQSKGNCSLSLEKGSHIWVPCEVKPGPFSDERVVRVESEAGEWVGFVQASFLKEPISTGTTYVQAVVVEVDGETFTARLPGQAVTPLLFKGVTSRLQGQGAF